MTGACLDGSSHRASWNLPPKRYNKAVRIRFLIAFLALLATYALAQDSSDKAASEKAAARNREAEESSSRDTRIDISPPKDDGELSRTSTSIPGIR